MHDENSDNKLTDKLKPQNCIQERLARMCGSLMCNKNHPQTVMQHRQQQNCKIAAIAALNADEDTNKHT
jgi:hypothetical protein